MVLSIGIEKGCFRCHPISTLCCRWVAAGKPRSRAATTTHRRSRRRRQCLSMDPPPRRQLASFSFLFPLRARAFGLRQSGRRAARGAGGRGWRYGAWQLSMAARCHVAGRGLRILPCASRAVVEPTCMHACMMEHGAGAAASPLNPWAARPSIDSID